MTGTSLMREVVLCMVEAQAKTDKLNKLLKEVADKGVEIVERSVTVPSITDDLVPILQIVYIFRAPVAVRLSFEEWEEDLTP